MEVLMASNFKGLLSQFRLMLAPKPETGEAAPEGLAADSGSQAPAEPQPAAAEVEPEPDIKIDSTRCDLHPLYLLRNTSIGIVVPSSATTTKVSASYCMKIDCSRHYIPEFGYFAFVEGESTHPTPSTTGSKCPKHDRYLALAKANGEFMWACLEPGCRSTAPYQEPENEANGGSVKQPEMAELAAV
jgi:hypothetical protein